MSIIMDAPRTTDTARELRADLVKRAAALRPLLAGNADATDRERGVPAENIGALAEAGLLTLMQPARYGGQQADFRTLLEVSREVGRACGSTAWVTALLNANAWFVGLFPARAQDDVWADAPGARVAGVVTPSGTARVVEGGYRVSGRGGGRPRGARGGCLARAGVRRGVTGRRGPRAGAGAAAGAERCGWC
ncbi:acyl-CoA dehydrogenase family protein, partial [Streptomyces lasiicapitis]|uniref:acyl-CoA dehydrogenase family protein n=1 Tax=Streptomyces lasiicapitis TaxID=1923961 RepID=UPI0036C4EBF6